MPSISTIFSPAHIKYPFFLMLALLVALIGLSTTSPTLRGKTCPPAKKEYCRRLEIAALATSGVFIGLVIYLGIAMYIQRLKILSSSTSSVEDKLYAAAHLI